MKSSFLLAAVAMTAVLLPAGVASSSVAASDQSDAFAECAVKQYEGAELLATQPGSEEEADVLAEFARRACAAPSMQPNLLRGAVAEQLFKADFGSVGARLRRDMVEVFTVDASEIGTLDANSRRQIDLVGFGTCVAAADPDKSVALLGTRAGSSEEAAVIAQLQPHFAPCLLEGERLDARKPELRGAFAEGAYRLALAHAIDQDIVVTGTADPARSVVCKMQTVSGSRFRKKTCLTQAQWTTRDRENELAANDTARRAREHDERRTTCITQANFSDKACLMQ